MRRHLKCLVLALAVGPLVASVGCDRFQASAGNQQGHDSFLPHKTARTNADGSATPGQQAIVRVLDEDTKFFNNGYAALAPNSQPSAVGKFFGDYAEHLKNSDTTGCPYEFREARNRHAKACLQLKTILERHPDAYDDVEFMSTLSLLFHGEKVRGRKLGGEVIDAVNLVTESYLEVYTTAGNYGVVVE